MSNAPTKVFIKIDSSAEQQDHLKPNRKTLKVLQKAATDKENLAGRPLLGKAFNKTKVQPELNLSEQAKRKKLHSQGTQTYQLQSTEGNCDCSPKKETITIEDLTSTDNPGEHYWELLAEKRRKALDATLTENLKLYERIEGLEEELNTSRQMLDETRNLVEVLTEMLNEADNKEGEVNQGASTSGSSTQLDLEKTTHNSDTDDD